LLTSAEFTALRISKIAAQPQTSSWVWLGEKTDNGTWQVGRLSGIATTNLSKGISAASWTIVAAWLNQENAQLCKQDQETNG
jgi:hypothetical protein